jgi:hypothetical protein
MLRRASVRTRPRAPRPARHAGPHQNARQGAHNGPSAPQHSTWTSAPPRPPRPPPPVPSCPWHPHAQNRHSAGRVAPPVVEPIAASARRCHDGQGRDRNPGDGAGTAQGDGPGDGPGGRPTDACRSWTPETRREQPSSAPLSPRCHRVVTVRRHVAVSLGGRPSGRVDHSADQSLSGSPPDYDPAGCQRCWCSSAPYPGLFRCAD